MWPLPMPSLRVGRHDGRHQLGGRRREGRLRQGRRRRGGRYGGRRRRGARCGRRPLRVGDVQGPVGAIDAVTRNLRLGGAGTPCVRKETDAGGRRRPRNARERDAGAARETSMQGVLAHRTRARETLAGAASARGTPAREKPRRASRPPTGRPPRGALCSSPGRSRARSAGWAAARLHQRVYFSPSRIFVSTTRTNHPSGRRQC